MRKRCNSPKRSGTVFCTDSIIAKCCSLLSLTLFFAFSSCNESKSTFGDLEVKAVNINNPISKSILMCNENPPLTGDTTKTETIDLKVCVGDIWVSQDEVKAGNPDNLNWIRLTKETNNDLRYFEENSLSPVSLPTGKYKSIKITFKNRFYRCCKLMNDESVYYELLETMGSTFDPCDVNDDSWAKTNYFSDAGNHYLNSDGVFELASEGEKMGMFEIFDSKTTLLQWRLGGGVEATCETNLIDLNKNRQWDCGTDDMEIICPPEVEVMFDFYVADN